MWSRTYCTYLFALHIFVILVLVLRNSHLHLSVKDLLSPEDTIDYGDKNVIG